MEMWHMGQGKLVRFWWLSVSRYVRFRVTIGFVVTVRWSQRYPAAMGIYYLAFVSQ